MHAPEATGDVVCPQVDLVVLAGGQGTRLGGADKAALEVGGVPLLDRLVGGVDLGGSVVVVGDTSLAEGGAAAVRRDAGRLRLTLEGPPDGGPVAGIAAGLVALGARPANWVAVVAVDQPEAAEALAALAATLSGLGPEVQAVSHVDPSGRRQWLLAIYRRAALEAAVAALPEVRHTSVRQVVAGLTWHEVAAGAEHLGDIDTPEDLAAWRERG